MKLTDEQKQILVAIAEGEDFERHRLGKWRYATVWEMYTDELVSMIIAGTIRLKPATEGGAQ